MAQIQSHELKVLDKAIHCAGCEARIQGLLARMPGVQEVKADHRTQKVRLTLDSGSVSIQEVKEKLEDLGYRTE
jgi:copper chaperone CopZ